MRMTRQTVLAIALYLPSLLPPTFPVQVRKSSMTGP
jgi:hypothetical protein